MKRHEGQTKLFQRRLEVAVSATPEEWAGQPERARAGTLNSKFFQSRNQNLNPDARPLVHSGRISRRLGHAN